MRIVALVVGAVTAVLLLAGCVPEQTRSSSSSGSTLSGSTSSPAAAGVVASPIADTTGSAGGTTSTMVTRVIDGDTFVVTGGAEVRVLGIDSCEAGTVGGRRAAQAAQAAILGQAVRLTSEPGVDLDRYGRQLRYVSYSGGDFAEMMVRGDHTAIYTKGRNDASAAVQARLRGLDANGRTCGGAATSSTTRTAPAVGTPRPVAKPVAKPAPKPVAKPAPKPAPRPVAASSYKNCAAARSAGAAPLYAGQPGYSAKLDRDGDGVACE